MFHDITSKLKLLKVLDVFQLLMIKRIQLTQPVILVNNYEKELNNKNNFDNVMFPTQ